MLWTLQSTLWPRWKRDETGETRFRAHFDPEKQVLIIYTDSIGDRSIEEALGTLKRGYAKWANRKDGEHEGEDRACA